MDHTNDSDRPSDDGSRPYEDDSRLRQPQFTGVDDPVSRAADGEAADSEDRPGTSLRSGRPEPAGEGHPEGTQQSSG